MGKIVKSRNNLNLIFLESFEEVVFTNERKEDMNIILLGKSGVGKSTWINSFFNYLMHGSFRSAAENGPVYAPVCTKFHIANQHANTDDIRQRLITIQIGEPENHCEEYASGNLNASATKMPMSHKVEARDGNYTITLIDTPGVRSTIGKDDEKNSKMVDEENVSYILNHMGRYPYINAFIVLLKPDEEKLDHAFASTLKTIFSQLDKSAKEHVVFIFTHSSYCQFDDTKTVVALSNFLKQEGIDIEINMRNVFYFDSSPFRYLATKCYGHQPKEDGFHMLDCWNKSVENCKRMIAYINQLGMHDTSFNEAINDTKSMIKLIINPLVKICKVNEENINTLNEAYENLATKKGIQVIYLKEKVLAYKKLDKSLTVCTNSDCFRKERILEDGKEVIKNLYDPICCSDCKVPFTSHDQPGSIMLFFCRSMDWSGKCRICKHPRTEHVHIAYELDEAERRFGMETKDVMKRMQELEMELDVIIGALAFFSQYLDCHSMFKEKGFVDMFIEKELTKAIQDLGYETQLKSDCEKKVKEMEDVNWDDLPIFIKECQETYESIGEKILLVTEIEQLEKTVRFNNLYEINTKASIESAQYLLALKKKRDEVFKDCQEEDFYSLEFLKIKQDSAMDSLKESEVKYAVYQSLAYSQKRLKEKTMLVEGVKKMQRRYVEKVSLRKERDELTPKTCQQMINWLTTMKYNGPTFKEIHEKITESKHKGILKPKRYKIGLDNIPKRAFNDIRRAVESTL